MTLGLPLISDVSGVMWHAIWWSLLGPGTLLRFKISATQMKKGRPQVKSTEVPCLRELY